MTKRWQRWAWLPLVAGLAWGLGACDSGGSGGEGASAGEEGAAEDTGGTAGGEGDVAEQADTGAGEGSAGEGDPGEGDSVEGEPGEGDPGEGDPGEGDPGEGDPGEGDPGEGGQVDVGPVDGVPAPGAMCPYEGAQGTFAGDTLKNMTFITCDGQVKSLWEIACGSAATWIFMTTQWCPYCKDTINGMPPIIEEFYPQGVRFAIVVWEDNFGNAPTYKTCEEYRDTFNLPADRVLWMYDPTQEKALQWYEADASGSVVVSLSIVVNRFGEIVEKNSTTNAGSIKWRLNYEMNKLKEEEGLQ